MNNKNLGFKRFVKRKVLLITWKGIVSFKNRLHCLIETSKQKFLKDCQKFILCYYYFKNLQVYLGKFLTGKNGPSVPLIFYEKKFITDFIEKPELFNSSFASQYLLTVNSSDLVTATVLQINHNLTLPSLIRKVVKGKTGK